MTRLCRMLALLALCAITLMPAACENDKPLPPEMKVSNDDVTLYARIAGNPGSGKVLVAISGGPGLSSDYMLSLEQLASPDLAVVTYDPRGTGRSTTPADNTANYHLDKYVADLEAVRQAVRAERVHLLGHSWGGLVAMYYATVHPERVNSMVLVGSGPPSARTLTAGQFRLQDRIGELAAQDLIPRELPQNDAESAQAILPAYFHDPSFEPPAEIIGTRFSPTAYQRTLSALGQYDLTADVAGLGHQILVLWGEGDPFDMEVGEATRDALSAARVEFVVLEECGHFWQECPDEFYPLVRDFLGLPIEP